jgi:LEA14-like dessication related protein
MKIVKLILSVLFLTGIMLTYQSCNVVKDITNTLADIGKLTFKIDNVSNMSIAGINLSNKRSINDISTGDVFKLTAAFATKSFPADFTLNLLAKNPNDGTTGKQKTNAFITSLDYRLILDDVNTINGDIKSEISVPGSGQSTIIPLGMGLDLYKFFGNKGYESIVNLGLAIGGVNSSPAKVKLDIKPTVRTPIGPMSYPNRITVISQEWK